MKKLFATLLIVLGCLPVLGQSCYWVFLTDKQNVTFDPYRYFDAKAIERYQQSGADLYDLTNYPLNGSYVSQVDALATEEVGQSRWLNAVAVMATPDQIDRIEQLPFVSRTHLIANEMQIASCRHEQPTETPALLDGEELPELTDQLVRMQGQRFREKGIDGKGMRIAVLDGGFPRVDTHEAFRHLRKNHRILDTWNFPNKTANVYGWNSHGLNTLSCITGIINGHQLGLATGAEFLLYRTEVEAEPFKEEVWWMQAMERADQHGANIISSSLGYGKERYFTKDMDGTSYVAKAGNLAARKGILVVNSAGNEADSKQWKTIITPADADSVLCVGGIESDNVHYRHIGFSSFGPSADGRLKPNVSAYGHALAAAKRGDDQTNWVYGTSFSCPLTSGFAACAWQSCPGKTAMEMFDLIQQSADLYPYYDYALGYGVPQASFFVNGPQKKAPTFRISESKEYVYVHLLKDAELATIFFNKQNPDGSLVKYSSVEFDSMSTADTLVFHKGSLDSCTLNVSYGGYMQSYRLNKEDRYAMQWERRDFEPEYKTAKTALRNRYNYDRTAEDLVPAKWGKNGLWEGGFYALYGLAVPTQTPEHDFNLWSPAFHVGYRVMRAFSKSYKIGLGVEYATAEYNYPLDKVTGFDGRFGLSQTGLDKKQFRRDEVGLELFQRIRMVPAGGVFANGLHWDLGLYASYSWSKYWVRYDEISGASGATMEFRNPSCVDNNKWNRVQWGLTTRFTYDWIGVYARYRMTDMFTQYDLAPGAIFLNLPRLEVGVQICF